MKVKTLYFVFSFGVKSYIMHMGSKREREGERRRHIVFFYFIPDLCVKKDFPITLVAHIHMTVTVNQLHDSTMTSLENK